MGCENEPLSDNLRGGEVIKHERTGLFYNEKRNSIRLKTFKPGDKFAFIYDGRGIWDRGMWTLIGEL